MGYSQQPAGTLPRHTLRSAAVGDVGTGGGGRGVPTTAAALEDGAADGAAIGRVVGAKHRGRAGLDALVLAGRDTR